MICFAIRMLSLSFLACFQVQTVHSILREHGEVRLLPVLWFFPTRGQKTKHIVFSMQQFTSLLSLRWGDRPYFQRNKHAEEAEWSILSVRPMSSLATLHISQKYRCVGRILHLHVSWILGFSVFCSIFCHSWIIQIHKKWFFENKIAFDYLYSAFREKSTMICAFVWERVQKECTT